MKYAEPVSITAGMISGMMTGFVVILTAFTVRTTPSIRIPAKTGKEGNNMKNIDIRIIVSDYGLKYKDIAHEMNISREWLSRLMNSDLNYENREKIMSAIEKIIEGAEVSNKQYKIGDKIKFKYFQNLKKRAFQLSSLGYGVSIIGLSDIEDCVLTITTLPKEDEQ